MFLQMIFPRRASKRGVGGWGTKGEPLGTFSSSISDVWCFCVVNNAKWRRCRQSKLAIHIPLAELNSLPCSKEWTLLTFETNLLSVPLIESSFAKAIGIRNCFIILLTVFVSTIKTAKNSLNVIKYPKKVENIKGVWYNNYVFLMWGIVASRDTGDNLWIKMHI